MFDIILDSVNEVIEMIEVLSDDWTWPPGCGPLCPL